MQILRCFLTNRIVGFNILSMIRKDKKFDIVPIFNQSVKGVWDDFINIEFACNAEIIRSFTGKFRNLCSKEEERQSHLCDYQRNLYDWQHNLAFAAYHKKEMVGFAQGFCFERSSELFSVYSKEAFLEHLYVLPEYQGQGIGQHLVEKMLEQLDNIYMIDLYCDEHLIPYYEKFGMFQSTGMVKRNYKMQAGSI